MAPVWFRGYPLVRERRARAYLETASRFRFGLALLSFLDPLPRALGKLKNRKSKSRNWRIWGDDVLPYRWFEFDIDIGHPLGNGFALSPNWSRQVLVFVLLRDRIPEIIKPWFVWAVAAIWFRGYSLRGEMRERAYLEAASRFRVGAALSFLASLRRALGGVKIEKPKIGKTISISPFWLFSTFDFSIYIFLLTPGTGRFAICMGGIDLFYVGHLRHMSFP